MSSNIDWSNTFFGYEPSGWAPFLAAGLFLVLGLLHVVQMIRFKTYYMGWIIAGAFFETIGYLIRLKSRADPTVMNIYAAQNGLIIIAPVFFAASEYILLSRIINHVGGQFSVIRPSRIAKIFVGIDIVSFLVQIAGTGLLVGTKDISMQDIGLKIMLFGLILQVISFAGFLIVAVLFHRRAAHVHGQWSKLIKALYISCIFILIRSIYRVIEFAQGFKSDLAHNERLMYIFDMGLMVLAIAVFIIVHPGKALNGASAGQPAKTDVETPMEMGRKRDDNHHREGRRH
ncbi:RTA1 like protein-domain-containing protein [Fimicolochytrium jonesii]|uniref:RTA1 like protein-domain-containing protein n=1 Tax=Fimicolochytrium jonesii TaxID=1396493 RepID=UPI0022FE5CE2|nr:RTA1 like protein-domain-containing protein [Fimicolochytrium jonesii]KAI8821448.1 RTA1 like protein-domain-containing protein [Fimicolochytrium jonesii]